MNYDLGKTQITEKVRVSSAAIFYDLGHLRYYQFETWIFSNDPGIKSHQVIHGTSHSTDTRLENKAMKVHQYIVDNLLKK